MQTGCKGGPNDPGASGGFLSAPPPGGFVPTLPGVRETPRVRTTRPPNGCPSCSETDVRGEHAGLPGGPAPCAPLLASYSQPLDPLVPPNSQTLAPNPPHPQLSWAEAAWPAVPCPIPLEATCLCPELTRPWPSPSWVSLPKPPPVLLAPSSGCARGARAIPLFLRQGRGGAWGCAPQPPLPPARSNHAFLTWTTRTWSCFCRPPAHVHPQRRAPQTPQPQSPRFRLSPSLSLGGPSSHAP